VRGLAGLTLLLGSTLFAPPVAAEPQVLLRFGTPAPEGTAWARETHALSRAVEAGTNGTVKVKFYLGGITGGELETLERIKRGQLEGIASGGPVCMRVAPSMRVLRIPGLIQSREESAYISGRLRQVFEQEARRQGFVTLGELGVGPDILFTRKPVKTVDELRKLKLWRWVEDDVLNLSLPAMDLQTVGTSLEKAGKAYDEQQIDGWLAVPAAALAFQWSIRARYLSDLRTGFLRGCIIIAARAFDPLTVEQQAAVRAAAAKAIARIEEVGRAQDEELLGGLFQRQGLTVVAASPAMRAEFFEAARRAREKLGDKLVPRELVARVQSMLADYRAEHGTR
jgi:TRAP-type C4-dicarboxylate transport system substrate-binding protein